MIGKASPKSRAGGGERVSAIFWRWLWGAIGLILSMPLTLCLVVLGRHFHQLRFLDVLLGDRPPLSPVESFYQRILAGDPTACRQQRKPDAFVPPRIIFVEVRGDSFQIRLSGLQRHTGREPADHGEFPARAVRIRAVTKRLIDLIVYPRLAGWEYTHDDAGTIIQAQRFADDIRIRAKAASPKFIAQNHDAVIKAITIIGVGKVSAQYRRYTESSKEIGGH